jgi:hypothetical protein
MVLSSKNDEDHVYYQEVAGHTAKTKYAEADSLTLCGWRCWSTLLSSYVSCVAARPRIYLLRSPCCVHQPVASYADSETSRGPQSRRFPHPRSALPYTLSHASTLGLHPRPLSGKIILRRTLSGSEANCHPPDDRWAAGASRCDMGTVPGPGTRCDKRESAARDTNISHKPRKPSCRVPG